MKIEQRCGRADRIGQQRDVHIYNFIVSDTVENRVREVLEEKLSVILKEMGVDKYSDVLDGEAAECDFTDIYMRSIGHQRQIEKNIYTVESEMKQQLANAKKYKDVIREEKDLTHLVGAESDFDVDVTLRTMLTYYECWQGHNPRLIDRISIGDEEITKHLKKEILQDRIEPLVAYPVFRDMCKLIGKMSEFQDEITLAQLKQKLFDEWGERTTLYHSIDKLVSTLKKFGVLTCDKPGKYHIEKHKIIREDISGFMVYTMMNVDDSGYYSFQEINSSTYLFPFEYRVSKESLLQDERFVMNNFGGELSIALVDKN